MRRVNDTVRSESWDDPAGPVGCRDGRMLCQVIKGPVGCREAANFELIKQGARFKGVRLQGCADMVVVLVACCF